ncbi:MAG TPA: TauD/TfdA family dioxygenase [Pyrinomonadaceae bacterium]|jgi:alpha-ketoglutarate-dependent taurine dioxygenase|nr:TauD/TfdA family dioxygenase [Pyrinomonadaceae bacterium]
MSNSESSGNLRAKGPGHIRRKAVSVEAGSPVTFTRLREDQRLPLVVLPDGDDVELVAWAKVSRELIEASLLKHGGILFRGFDITTAAALDAFIKVVSTQAAAYQEPTSPRTHVSGNVYTSTDYPPAERILLHNENSYSASWPLRLFFCCVTPAEQGGATPVADSRRIYRRLDPRVRERFIQKQVMYVRNFGDGLAIPWQSVFNISDRAEMEQYCWQRGIEVKWKDENRLRIRYVRPAVATHPRTHDTVWFNHVLLFHIGMREPAVREALLNAFAEDDLPYNVFYGDGSRIEADDLATVSAAYDQETVSFDWRTGDVLMLDNMLAAHGREPFVGSRRRILVSMADPVVP